MILRPFSLFSQTTYLDVAIWEIHSYFCLSLKHILCLKYMAQRSPDYQAPSYQSFGQLTQGCLVLSRAPSKASVYIASFMDLGLLSLRRCYIMLYAYSGGLYVLLFISCSCRTSIVTYRRTKVFFIKAHLLGFTASRLELSYQMREHILLFVT